MVHANVQQLIKHFTEILEQSPLDRSESTEDVLLRFSESLATELGEILVQSPYNDGVKMYFDEKIARYEVKKAVGL